MAGRRYCVISPCRDEAAHVRRTLESVVNQTVPPALWVIVDDGSSDGTGAILAEYAARYDFIRVVRREDRGRRSVGPGVVDAFYAGYETIYPGAYAYLCKLDGDVEVPPAYFETLMERMEANPRLGTCSGKPYYVAKGSGRLVSEACGDEMSAGMSKFYRTECFEEIGGFVRAVMWDGIDCHRCRMLGWMACSWDEPGLRVVHRRQMGASENGVLTGRVRHGCGQYFMGTGLAYMTASALYRMTRPPVVTGGLAMWWGYVRSWMRGVQRHEDVELRRFVRAYQRRCLWVGKARATEEIHRQIARGGASARRAAATVPG